MSRKPSIDRLWQLFSLDVEAGVLRRRVSTSSRGRAGNLAGVLHKASGYRIVTVDGQKLREHVLIWFMLYGEWIPRRVDHEDRNRSNNRPSNLRKASESQQRQNASLRSDNTTGQRGVSVIAGGKYFMARIVMDGNAKYLGCFPTAVLAGEAARAARLKHFGSYAPAYDLETR